MPGVTSPHRTHRATRADIAATLVILGATVLVIGGRAALRKLSSHPSSEQCAQLLDRYVEHIAFAVDPKPASSALTERRTLARAVAEGKGPIADADMRKAAFAECTTELTRDEAECAMKAENADAFERCLPVR